MKKVLLLNPPSAIPCARVLHRANIGKPAYVWPVVDFVCLSGYLWEFGLSVDYKDFQIDRKTSIWNFLDQNQYDVIISSYSPFFEDEDLNLLGEVKRIYPDVNIILLANHNDRLDKQHSEKILRNNNFISAIIFDYAYNNLALFLEGVRSREIYNVLYLNNGDFCGRIENIPEKVKIPIPRHELFISNSYFHYDSVGGYVTSSISSFGCKKGCPFCWSHKLYPAVSGRTPESLLAEMEHIVNCGISEVYFHDLTFGYSKENLLRFCNLVNERGVKLRWFCSSRFDLMSPEIIRAMAGAGCRCIEFGLESGNYQVRKLYGKDCSDEVIKDVVQMCKKNRIRVSVFVILGLPEETLFDMKKSIDFVKNMGFDYVALNVAWAESSTDFTEKLNSNIKDVSRHKALQQMNFEHPYVSTDELEKFYRKCYRDFYLNPRFIIKQLAGIRSIKKIRNMFGIFRELFARDKI